MITTARSLTLALVALVGLVATACGEEFDNSPPPDDEQSVEVMDDFDAEGALIAKGGGGLVTCATARPAPGYVCIDGPQGAHIVKDLCPLVRCASGRHCQMQYNGTAACVY